MNESPDTQSRGKRHLPVSLSLAPSLQDLFFKYSWNNFLHFQVELCVASVLNHPSGEDRPSVGLQNHSEPPPTVPDPPGQDEGGETAKPADPEGSIHSTLVSHVGAPPTPPPPAPELLHGAPVLLPSLIPGVDNNCF